MKYEELRLRGRDRDSRLQLLKDQVQADRERQRVGAAEQANQISGLQAQLAALTLQVEALRSAPLPPPGPSMLQQPVVRDFFSQTPNPQPPTDVYGQFYQDPNPQPPQPLPANTPRRDTRRVFTQHRKTTRTSRQRQPVQYDVQRLPVYSLRVSELSEDSDRCQALVPAARPELKGGQELCGWRARSWRK